MSRIKTLEELRANHGRVVQAQYFGQPNGYGKIIAQGAPQEFGNLPGLGYTIALEYPPGGVPVMVGVTNVMLNDGSVVLTLVEDEAAFAGMRFSDR